MRSLLMIAAVICFTPSAYSEEADVIKPGMRINDIERLLTKHKYECGEKVRMAMLSDEKDTDLFFCQVDHEIMLSFSFNTKTNVVRSIDLHVYPGPPRPKGDRVDSSRPVRKIVLEEESVFTVSLERGPQRSPIDSCGKDSGEDPFGF